MLISARAINWFWWVVPGQFGTNSSGKLVFVEPGNRLGPPYPIGFFSPGYAKIILDMITLHDNNRYIIRIMRIKNKRYAY